MYMAKSIGREQEIEVCSSDYTYTDYYDLSLIKVIRELTIANCYSLWSQLID